VGSRRLCEVGSRRRGVWLGGSLCLSLCFCSFFLDLELCARGKGCCRDLLGEGGSGGGWRVLPYCIRRWAEDRSRDCAGGLNRIELKDGSVMYSLSPNGTSKRRKRGCGRFDSSWDELGVGM